MKEEIFNLIKSRQYVSFAELQNCIPGFKGDYSFGLGEYNIWFWFTCSTEATDALSELKSKKKIFIHSASYLTYTLDGLAPDVPVVKKFRKYKSDRWAPVCFCTFPTEEEKKAAI